MANIITALVGAPCGLIPIWLGYSFRAGSLLIDGTEGAVLAAATGAAVALLVKYALRKEFG